MLASGEPRPGMGVASTDPNWSSRSRDFHMGTQHLTIASVCSSEAQRTASPFRPLSTTNRIHRKPSSAHDALRGSWRSWQTETTPATVRDVERRCALVNIRSPRANLATAMIKDREELRAGATIAIIDTYAVRGPLVLRSMQNEISKKPSPPLVLPQR